MRKRFTGWVCLFVFLFLFQHNAAAQQKRLYVSSDDHTDYMWSADEAGYDTLIVNMLDWWMDHNDQTASNAIPYQSKWNCDGSFWVSLYKKHRSPAQFDRLIEQIRAGKITVPYSPLVCTYGGMPAEAVLRGMYYAGQLERTYNLNFDMAVAMENQTLPLGLSSLWKGSGANYCWDGVCNCSTYITGLGSRQNEIYWYNGLDTNKILLKWYRMQDTTENYGVGGYAEARNINTAIDDISTKYDSAFFPYKIAAAFGVGHDDLQTLSDDLIPAAMDPGNSNASQQVYVSNEVDFFKAFDSAYGANLPVKTQTFGNEWDLTCASIAEVSGKMKRSIEKLRAAEAMSAIITNYYPTYAGGLDSLKKEAWQAISLFWEHSLGFETGGVGLSERSDFQRRLETTFSSYVDELYTLAKSNLADLVRNPTAKPRFFVFNPLGWKRTDYADYEYSGSTNIHLIELNSGAETPFQFITKSGVNFIRVLADSIPSVGYKVFEIENGPGTTFPDAGINTGNVVENDFFKVTYTNQGVLTSIKDKLNSNKELVTVTDGKYANDLGTGLANIGTAVVESVGPVSITILTNTSAAPVAHSTRITLYKNIPRLEIDNQITQNFTDSVLAWSYSFNAATPEVWHEETGAVIKAKLTTHGGHYATQNARYDWSTLNHFASVNEGSGYGVSLSNQDCYFMKIGNSSLTTLDENSAQLNVLAGGRIGGLGIPDQGDNEFNQRFAITTHTAYSAANDMKKALEHQNFMVCATMSNPATFLLPYEYSFVNNSDPGSLIWTVKPTEEGVDRGTVTRVWNLSNTDVAPTLAYSLYINEAKRITHVETDMNANAYDGRNLFTSLGHNEMKSFRVKLSVFPLAVQLLSFTGDKIQQSNVLQWKVANELNINGYQLERSTDGQHFISVTNVTVATGAATNYYNYTDKSVNNDIAYYYRLKIINSDNSFGYSNTIIIKADKDASAILVYPNPADNILKANIILDKKSRCNVMIINEAGSVVKTMSSPLFERGSNYYTMSIMELPAGEYRLVIITSDDKKYNKSFIKR
jgi:alpha-mannosidase